MTLPGTSNSQRTMANHVHELTALVARCEADPNMNPKTLTRLRARLAEAEREMEALR